MTYLAKMKDENGWTEYELDARDTDEAFDQIAARMLDEGREGELVVIEGF